MQDTRLEVTTNGTISLTWLDEIPSDKYHKWLVNLSDDVLEIAEFIEYSCSDLSNNKSL